MDYFNNIREVESWHRGAWKLDTQAAGERALLIQAVTPVSSLPVVREIDYDLF